MNQKKKAFQLFTCRVLTWIGVPPVPLAALLLLSFAAFCSSFSFSALSFEAILAFSSSISLGLFSITCRARGSKIKSQCEEAFEWAHVRVRVRVSRPAPRRIPPAMRSQTAGRRWARCRWPSRTRPWAAPRPATCSHWTATARTGCLQDAKQTHHRLKSTVSLRPPTNKKK